MDLTGLADFNLVAKHGGFGAASRASGQSKATLSRRVRELEESLGVRLIERGARPLHMTEEGAVLHARTELPFVAIADALQDVKAGLGRPSGRLRVSAPLLFANLALGPLAAAFHVAYPDVLLEVVTDDRFIDLLADDMDIVVRANPRPDDNLVGRCFLRNPLVLVAPPGMPKPVADAGGGMPACAAVMRVGVADGEVWTVTDPADGAQRSYRPAAVMRLSSPLSIRDAVCAGAGASLIPQTVVADDLAAGRLMLWGTSVRPPIEVWVLHTSRRLVSPKVTAFVNFICDYYPDSARR